MENKLMSLYFMNYKHIFDFICYFSSFLVSQYDKPGRLGRQIDSLLRPPVNSPRSARQRDILFAEFQSNLAKKQGKAWDAIYEGELVSRDAVAERTLISETNTTNAHPFTDDRKDVEGVDEQSESVKINFFNVVHKLFFCFIHFNL